LSTSLSNTLICDTNLRIKPRHVSQKGWCDAVESISARRMPQAHAPNTAVSTKTPPPGSAAAGGGGGGGGGGGAEGVSGSNQAPS